MRREERRGPGLFGERAMPVAANVRPAAPARIVLMPRAQLARREGAEGAEWMIMCALVA